MYKMLSKKDLESCQYVEEESDKLVRVYLKPDGKKIRIGRKQETEEAKSFLTKTEKAYYVQHGELIAIVYISSRRGWTERKAKEFLKACRFHGRNEEIAAIKSPSVEHQVEEKEQLEQALEVNWEEAVIVEQLKKVVKEPKPKATYGSGIGVYKALIDGDYYDL